MTVSVIVLTKNEEIHLDRCLSSVSSFAKEIIIVDSGSTDNTILIANKYRAKIFLNPWLNYSAQFKFALNHVDPENSWILRIDADEYLTDELISSLRSFLFSNNSLIDGAYLPRRMCFLSKPIRFGGIFPAYMLRLFRVGKGDIEARWMDEHIKVLGSTVMLKGELIDDNLNSLSWWIDKHNGYASREAIDLLNLEFGFMFLDSISSSNNLTQASLKRLFKEKVYFRLPVFFRSFIYFLYRYIFRCGFLDGKVGFMFHFLQGFWYRYLVDCKVFEVKNYMALNGCDIRVAIREVLRIEV